jgi:FixJ family two-component response regulator
MSARVQLVGTIQVVDDDRAFRTAIGRVLSAAGHSARLYASPAEYLSTAEPVPGPSCLIVDLRMPGANGLEFQTALTERGNARPVIFLSGHGDVPSTVRAMRAGAMDFLTKPVPTAVLLEAIRIALERDVQRAAHDTHLAEVKSRYATLTPRERQVMAGVIAGRLNKQICYALHSAERTVKTHRARVMEKMAVRSVAELVRRAEELAAAGVALEPTPAGL